jgi:FkbM family methyltransferase
MHPKLSVHHIGGRDGTRGFPYLQAFESDLINVLYDADPECIDQIRQRNSILKSENYVFPICLGETPGKVKFHVNLDPFTSSILQTNPEYQDFYAPQGDLDYCWGESSRTMEIHEFDVETIDHVFEHKLLNCPPPDFLSVDAQGSEFEILCGARQTLENSILGLVLEVEFHPIYENQKLFGDIFRLLSQHEFYFVKFLRFIEFAPHRAPLGLRGDCFQIAADALFLKRSRPRSVARDSPCERSLKLAKLAFIAVAFGQMEYALSVLDQHESLGPVVFPPDWKETGFMQFLSRLHALSKDWTQIFRPTFGERYTFAASKARFQTFDQNGPVRNLAPDSPASSLLRRVTRSVRRALGRRLPRLGAAYHAFKWYRPAPVEAESEIEAMLKSYGLSDQAAILKTQREGSGPY